MLLRASEQPNGDRISKLFCACQSSLSNHPWYPPVEKLRRSGSRSRCEETAVVDLFNPRSTETKLFFPPRFTAICGRCSYFFSPSPSPINPFTIKILWPPPRWRNHCYRRALAICVEKPFLRRRQTWLILVNTGIMRGGITLEFLLFAGAFTSVCQSLSHL